MMASLEGTQAHESKLYYELSHLYDRLFTRVFYPRIAEVIHSLNIKPGAQVLEVGVGTGLSFTAYPTHCQVTGVDLAPDMLEQAQDKISQNGWRHLKVMEMDALNLKFPDNTFDYIMAFHVVSVVPDAGALMHEALRVGKPGATVVIINHFRSRNRVLAALDSFIEPIPEARLVHACLRRGGGCDTARGHADLQDLAPLTLHDRCRQEPQVGAARAPG